MASEPFNGAARRQALKCLAYGGAGTLFTLAGGVLVPTALAAADGRSEERRVGKEC